MALSDPDGVQNIMVDCYLTIVLVNRLYFFKLVKMKFEKTINPPELNSINILNSSKNHKHP